MSNPRDEEKDFPSFIKAGDLWIKVCFKRSRTYGFVSPIRIKDWFIHVATVGDIEYPNGMIEDLTEDIGEFVANWKKKRSISG